MVCETAGHSIGETFFMEVPDVRRRIPMPMRLLVLGGGWALMALVALQIGAANPERAAADPPPRTANVPAAEPAPPEVGFGMEPLDKVMRETMKKFGVPGGALAVAKDGKLVVAKGYGWANVATRQPVTVDSLFCLASVGKAVTSVAVMRLVQDGKLSLDDRVYGLLGRPKPLDGFQLDPRVQDITVRHLLLHAAGFNPNKGGEYLRMPKKIAKQTGHKLPLSDELIIRYAAQPAAGVRPRHGRALLEFRFLPGP